MEWRLPGIWGFGVGVSDPLMQGLAGTQARFGLRHKMLWWRFSGFTAFAGLQEAVGELDSFNRP